MKVQLHVTVVYIEILGIVVAYFLMHCTADQTTSHQAFNNFGILRYNKILQTLQFSKCTELLRLTSKVCAKQICCKKK